MKVIAIFMAGMGLLAGGLFTMRWTLTKVFIHSFHQYLSQLTLTPLRSLLVGMIAAAFMQSSSALTLVTIGLISADLLPFESGLGIILGANIGTCSTVQLMTVSIPLRYLATLLIFCCFFALVLPKYRSITLSLTGLCGMLTGLSFLNASLANAVELSTVLTYLENASHQPLLGISGGVLLTLLFQSSSASTALLMSLTGQGLIDLTAAAYSVYGNNIGSCIPSLLVGLTAPLTAKRVAVSHLILNVLGVVCFFPFTQHIIKMATLLSVNLPEQVAMIHTLFNIISSVVVLVFIKSFSRLIIFLVR
ncbi:MAG: Na+/Picotransporter [Firmicutes bacterium]|nr:Na+/Picotransporter [Bacillota bacterium]